MGDQQEEFKEVAIALYNSLNLKLLPDVGIDVLSTRDIHNSGMISNNQSQQETGPKISPAQRLPSCARFQGSSTKAVWFQHPKSLY
jgi:hypothetical protein